jgi:hypothetical protein
MNERIKELAEQATTIEYGADRGFDRVTFDKEKFAELIVRECADIAKGEPANFSDRDPYKIGRRSAGIDVLKHFGVEE